MILTNKLNMSMDDKIAKTTIYYKMGGESG